MDTDKVYVYDSESKEPQLEQIEDHFVTAPSTPENGVFGADADANCEENNNVCSAVKDEDCKLVDEAAVVDEVVEECGSESLSYSPTVQFTELPHLVIEHIINHLDIEAMLALRITCKIAKKWVETAKFMSSFYITINSKDEMLSLVQSARMFPTTKWRKCSLVDNSYASYESFPGFVSYHCDYISHIHVCYFNGGLAQILFLSACENLKSLKIDEMDVRQNPALVIASDKTLKAKCPKLLDVFTSLRVLMIGDIYYNNVKQLVFYQTFLQRCKKLEELNVPRPHGPNNISWDAVKGVQLKFIIGPISEYLYKKPVTSPIKTDIKILDMEGVFSKHFPALAECCVRTGSHTLFQNVNDKHIKKLFTQEEDVIKRVFSLKEKIDDRRPILKWANLDSLYVRSYRCDVRNEYPGEVAFPKLRCLTIVMDSKSREDPSFVMLQRLICLLVHVKREALTEFILQWPLFSHDTPQDYIRANEFAYNFCNLTKLQISGWSAPDDDYLHICSTLKKLRVLILEDCINLTDFGLLGSKDLDEPVVLQLKDLRRLEIRNKTNPSFITDECFECAFQHMRLHYLLVESFQMSAPVFKSLVLYSYGVSRLLGAEEIPSYETILMFNCRAGGKTTMKGYKFLLEGVCSLTIQRILTPNVLPSEVTCEQFTAFVTNKCNFPNIVLLNESDAMG